ncbi:hypothetical protein [Pedobacter sp. UYP1]|uniref:hypothetical protein n=1 Tax=Pedobacter sp. UYP1 TaxID=1756396 RepID=UPI003395278E
MGILNLFKKKEPINTTNEDDNGELPSLSDFKFYYLYGFTDQPNQVSADFDQFNALYKLVIGQIGGAAITNSYHPYFIVNPKGTTVWAAAYIKLYINENKGEVFNNISTAAAIYGVDTSPILKDMHVWPDTRLTNAENPVFSKYVPFIIPFLVSASHPDSSLPESSHPELNWDKEINSGMATKGNATAYVEQVNAAIKFFMPPPAFIIGFDEFDENNPSGMIDKFIECKSMFKAEA